MTMVFDRYPEGGNERVLALAIADHAHDDGTHIYPAIDVLAQKALQSRRTVQRLIAKMVAMGWLELVSAATGRRGMTNEYRISAAWIAGDSLPVRGVSLTPHDSKEVIHTGAKLTPHKSKGRGVTAGAWGVTGGLRGDTAMAPKPSEPSITNTPLPPGGGADGFEAMFEAFPNKANRSKAERRWVRIAPGAELRACMLAAVAAQCRTPKWRKDGGQYIPELATWLRNKCWLDDASPLLSPGWWLDSEGVKSMGERLGRPFSLGALGNAFTDDQRTEHWRAYRAEVFAAAGCGPWAERRAA